jgi:hypothetical protein
MSINKYDYVRSATQTRTHHCHWPGCTEQVPPAKWGCREHWYRLPIGIRNKIWGAFRPGQEIDGNPSLAYIRAAREAQDWIMRKGGGRVTSEEPCDGR